VVLPQQKRQTKLKLHFIFVFALAGLQKLFMVFPDFSLTTLQFPDFFR